MALYEPNRLNDILKDEQESPVGFSREKVSVADGQSLLVGAVIGKILFSVPTTGTKTGTGGGTCASVTGGKKTKLGTYKLTCVAAATDGGRFQVVDPDGIRLADALVGVAYSSPQINFTIADGAPDFAVGDYFTISVTVGSLKVKALDTAATDGSQIAYGMMREDCTASGADKKAIATIKNAQIVASKLVWPAGITDNQKTAALAELDAKGIASVEEV